MKCSSQKIALAHSLANLLEYPKPIYFPSSINPSFQFEKPKTMLAKKT